MFCIAEFPGIGNRKDVAVVHKTWICGNKCYWPDFWKTTSRLNQAVKQGEKPNPQTWYLYKIRIIGNKYFVSYEEARNHLCLSTIQSDLSSNEDHNWLRKRTIPADDSSGSENGISQNAETSKLRKRKSAKLKRDTEVDLPQPPCFPSEVCLPRGKPFLCAVADMKKESIAVASEANGAINSDLNVTNYPEPEDPQPPIILEDYEYDVAGRGGPVQLFMQTNQAWTYKDSSQNVSFPQPRPFQQPHVNQSFQGFNGCTPYIPPGVPPSFDFFEFVSTTQTNQQLLLAKMDIIMDLVRTLLEGRQVTNRTSELNDATLSLPFTDMVTFKAFEERKGENLTLTSSLILVLGVTGGNTPNQVVYRVMTELMTDELMLLHTLKGQTGKRAFKDTLYFNCVYEAVKKQGKGQSMTKKEIEDAMDYWLRKAATRIDSKKKKQSRAEKNNTTSGDGEVGENQ